MKNVLLKGFTLASLVLILAAAGVTKETPDWIVRISGLLQFNGGWDFWYYEGADTPDNSDDYAGLNGVQGKSFTFTEGYPRCLVLKLPSLMPPAGDLVFRLFCQSNSLTSTQKNCIPETCPSKSHSPHSP